MGKPREYVESTHCQWKESALEVEFAFVNDRQVRKILKKLSNKSSFSKVCVSLSYIKVKNIDQKWDKRSHFWI